MTPPLVTKPLIVAPVTDGGEAGLSESVGVGPAGDRPSDPPQAAAPSKALTIKAIAGIRRRFMVDRCSLMTVEPFSDSKGGAVLLLLPCAVSLRLSRFSSEHAGCHWNTGFERLLEARRLTADLLVQFLKALMPATARSWRIPTIPRLRLPVKRSRPPNRRRKTRTRWRRCFQDLGYSAEREHAR